MPLNTEGAPGYGSVAAGEMPAFSGSTSESVPLLIPESESELNRWRPLNKEELQLQGGTPGWRKVRSYLMLLFWLGWLGMLAGAVVVLVNSPRPVATPLLWWQNALFYRLQPAATGGAAYWPGDISVVRDHLSDLPTLGVGALILEGLFAKDTSDLRVIDERAGTEAQLEQLLVEGNRAGIKVVLDICELELLGPTSPAGGGGEESVDPAASVQDGLRYWLERGVAGFGICDTDRAYTEKTGESLPALGGTINGTLVDLVIKSLLPEEKQLLSAQEVAASIEAHLQTPQGDLWPCWTLGGEAVVGLQGILLVLIMTLPGSSVIQYGQEVLPTQNVAFNGSVAHGEGNGSEEIDERLERASLALIGSLRNSRAREESLLYGSFTFLPYNPTSPSANSAYSSSFSNSTTPASSSVPVLAFLRSWGCAHLLVVLNLSPEPRILDPAWLPNMPASGMFIASTSTDRMGSMALDELTLRPLEAVVVKLFESGSYS
ncbi:amino acid transporter heavy chain SLC3A2 [Aplochiton taeniatus]